MKRPILVLLLFAAAFAGRTAEWSGPVTLRETVAAIRPAASQKPAERLSILTPGNGHEKTVTFILGGISPTQISTLRIHGMNGRLVADLSGSVRPGSDRVAWKRPDLSRGLFFATLRSGNRKTTVRFVIVK